MLCGLVTYIWIMLRTLSQFYGVLRRKKNKRILLNHWNVSVSNKILRKRDGKDIKWNSVNWFSNEMHQIYLTKRYIIIIHSINKYYNLKVNKLPLPNSLCLSFTRHSFMPKDAKWAEEKLFKTQLHTKFSSPCLSVHRWPLWVIYKFKGFV